MRIHLGADHKGFALARQLESWLASEGHEVINHGAAELDNGDDHTVFDILVSHAVIVDEDNALETRGILVGGDGSGEVIAANKVNGARAFTALTTAQVEAARTNANANVLVIPADFVDLATAKQLVASLVATPFSYTIDAARRIIQTNEYENSQTIEGWNVADEFQDSGLRYANPGSH